MFKKKIIGSVISVILAGAAFSPLAMAEEYNERAIQMPIDVNKGEAAELIAKIFAEGVQKHYGKPVALEVMPSEGGAKAKSEIVNADPDGFTFTITATSSLYSAPNALDKSLTEFSLVSNIATVPNVLVVSNSSATKDFKSFEAEIKKNKKGNIATRGKASAGNLIIHNIKNEADLPATITPFANSSVAVNDVISGKIEAAFVSLPLAIKQIQEGKLVPIAVSSSARVKDFPNVPTFKDLGFDKSSREVNFGVLAQAGISGETKAKLNSLVEKVMKDSETVSKLEKIGVKVNLIKDDALVQQVKADNQFYNDVYKVVR